MNLEFGMEKNSKDISSMKAFLSFFSVCLRFAPKGGWEAFYAKHPETYEGYNYSDEEEDEESGDEYDFDDDDGFGYDFDDFNPFGYGYGYGFGFGYGYDHHGHGYHSP